MKIKENSGLIEFSPTEELLNEKLISGAIWECLKNNDPEGVIEVIQTYLYAKNKAEKFRRNDLSKTTYHHAIKGKNPTIKTLAKMVNCCIEV